MAGELTRLLQAASDGDEPALNRLVALLYVDLRQLARTMQCGRFATFDTTSLVHECYLRLLDSDQLVINDREHFFNLAARVMRQLSCDRARERLAAKRGGGAAHVELREDHAISDGEAEYLLALDQALAALSDRHPRRARVVACRFFAGLSESETAEALGRPLRTIQRDWKAARGWLARRLEA